MTDLNILFLTRKGKGYVGAPNTRHMFEQTVAQQCNVEWAGKGWKHYKEGETLDETVKRVMPQADWVIDADNTLHLPKPRSRRYRLGLFTSDLHGKHYYNTKEPVRFAEMINKAGYDAVFMRYQKVAGYTQPDTCFTDALRVPRHWVPWSVDVEKHTWKRKKIDAGFIGAHYPSVYPLRDNIYNNLTEKFKTYNTVCVESPRGATYQREWSTTEGVVGDEYVELLNRLKIILFGSSIYRYPVQKYFEASASACLVLADIPSTGEELGFTEKTMVPITKENWIDKLRYYLENPSEAKKIARAGLKNTLIHHSHETRAKQWIEMIK